MNRTEQVLRSIGLCLFLFSCNASDQGIHPQVKPLTESVYASITVKPEDMYDVFATASGIIDQVLVQEGDVVSEDQIIAVIRATGPSVAMDNARLSTALARENLQGNASLLVTLNKEIQTLTEQVHLDSLNYARQDRLWAQRIGSLSDLENRRLKYETSANSLANQKVRLSQTKNDLSNGYRQSQNMQRNAESSFDDLTIRSRFDGKVYSILKEAGELFDQRTPLAQIGRADTYVIEMLVDEVDIARVELGQTTWVTLDAYPGQVFKVVISKIYPLKDERNQTFMLESKFIDQPAKLYAGLSGEANIVLSQKQRALTIPLEYLMDGDRVKTEDGEVAVQIGMRTIDKVEILSGLDSSDVIIKP